MVNAHILYKLEHNSTRRTDKYFALNEFIEAVIGAWRTPDLPDSVKIMHRKKENNSMRTSNVLHVPGLLHHDNSSDGRRQCAECKERANTFCLTCNVALHQPLVGCSKEEQLQHCCWSSYHLKD